MSDNPTISVIMATFNEPPEIVSQSIESILSQSFSDFELLIFDDSTNRATVSAIDSFAYDDRVKVYRSENRVGFVPSLNKGLELAHGKYIARMDGDDISLPNRFESEVRFLNANSSIAIVGGNINIINKDNITISHRKYPSCGLRLWLHSCVRSPLAHPTVMMRREIVDAGFRYDESLERSEDLDLWLRLMNKGYKVANLPNTILNYRVLDNFEDKRSSDIQRKYTFKVRKKNFSWRRPFFSLCSLVGGWLFAYLPMDFIKSLYSKENNRLSANKSI